MLSTDRIMWYGVVYTSIRMIVGATSAIYLLSHGLTLVDLGIMKSLQAGIILLIDIPTSYFSDRYGRKICLIISMVLGFLWLLLTGTSNLIYLFFVAEAFNAVSLSFNSGSSIALLVENHKIDYPETPVRECLGKYNLYSTIGMAIAALIGSACFAASSRTPWIIAASLLLTQLIGGRWALRGVDQFKRKKNNTVPQNEMLKGIFSILTKETNFWGIMLILFSMCYQVLIQFWQPMSQSGVGIQNTAAYFGLLFALILAAQAVASWVIKYQSTLKAGIYLAIFGLISAAILLQVGLSMISLLLPLCLFVLFFFLKIGMINSQSGLHDSVGDEYRATVESGYASVMRILVLIILPSMGFLITRIGFSALTLLCGSAGVALILISYILKSGKLSTN